MNEETGFWFGVAGWLLTGTAFLWLLWSRLRSRRMIRRVRQWREESALLEREVEQCRLAYEAAFQRADDQAMRVQLARMEELTEHYRERAVAYFPELAKPCPPARPVPPA